MKDVIRTLVVDDEEVIRSILKRALELNGHSVATASSGEEALTVLRDTPFDAAILDLNLGGRADGLRVLEAIRWRWPDMVVVILTAHGSLDSAITAIRDDVDDYLLKPVRPSEVRRVVERALEQRAVEQRETKDGQREGEERRTLQIGNLSVDLDLHQVTRDGQPLELPPKELKLLVHLMQNAHRVVPPPELVRVVRDYEPDSLYEARQIIKWYVYRLRQAIEVDPSNPRSIVNVRGVGYKFEEQPQTLTE